MKSGCAILCVFLFSVIAHADVVIVQKVESGSQRLEMTMKIKDIRMRMDVSPEVSTIFDGNGNVITLMHKKKSFMRISASAAKELIAKTGKVAGGVPPKLVLTGKKEKLNGLETEEFTCTLPRQTVHYWVAKTFPNSASLLDQIKKSQAGSIAELSKELMPGPADFNGLPVKTEYEVNGKKTIVTLVSVKEEPVDAAAFNPPSDYTEIAVPNFNVSAPPTELEQH